MPDANTDGRLVRAGANDPHENLAMEQFLIDAVRENEVILYLWQNRPTVVIGRNQNPWAECDADAMRRDGVTLARRSSGGGAVYQDLGNLNFTFIARDASYDAGRQTGYVLEALRSLGLDAVQTGRNDLTIGGFKFSGHAYSSRDQRRCHHGTLMVSVDTEALARYLTVPAAKLTGKGVRSVRSRVRNLADWDPGITVERVSDALVGVFKRAHAGVSEWNPGRDGAGAVEAYRTRYAGDDWNWGQTFAFDCELETRFPWGGVVVRLGVAGGLISESKVFTDALDAGLAEKLERRLKGCRFAAADMAAAVRPVGDELAEWIAGSGL